MIGTGLIGRMRYNVRRVDDGDVVALSLALAEAMDAGAVLGLDVAAAAMAGEARALSAARLACMALVRQAYGQAGLMARAGLTLAVEAGDALGERVQGVAALGADVHLAQAMGEAMRGAARCGICAWLDWQAGEALGALARLGCDVPLGRMVADEAFGAQVARESFVLEEGYFDVELAPGAVLVVDSGGYAVLLDGQDAIAAQRGDWLWLDRSVYDVRFEVAEGDLADLAVEGLYLVRWL